jgi:hypothetical protein
VITFSWTVADISCNNRYLRGRGNPEAAKRYLGLALEICKQSHMMQTSLVNDLCRCIKAVADETGDAQLLGEFTPLPGEEREEVNPGTPVHGNQHFHAFLAPQISNPVSRHEDNGDSPSDSRETEYFTS